MISRKRVEMVVFDEGEGVQVDFKFSEEFDCDTPSPVEEVAMAMFMYVSETLKGDIINIGDSDE